MTGEDTMKHINPTTKFTAQPAPASLLETQVKVAIFGSFATALGAFGNAISIFLGLGEE
jgi:hypothetical protein